MDCKNEVEIQMFKQNKKIKVRFGNRLAYLFSLFGSDTVLVLLHFKKEKKIYKYIYTDLSLHRMALVKGYIFPLQLKINKMVSNIPPQYYFYFLLVFQVNRKSFFLF